MVSGVKMIALVNWRASLCQNDRKENTGQNEEGMGGAWVSESELGGKDESKSTDINVWRCSIISLTMIYRISINHAYLHVCLHIKHLACTWGSPDPPVILPRGGTKTVICTLRQPKTLWTRKDSWKPGGVSRCGWKSISSFFLLLCPAPGSLMLPSADLLLPILLLFLMTIPIHHLLPPSFHLSRVYPVIQSYIFQ